MKHRTLALMICTVFVILSALPKDGIARFYECDHVDTVISKAKKSELGKREYYFRHYPHVVLAHLVGVTIKYDEGYPALLSGPLQTGTFNRETIYRFKVMKSWKGDPGDEVISKLANTIEVKSPDQPMPIGSPSNASAQWFVTGAVYVLYLPDKGAKDIYDHQDIYRCNPSLKISKYEWPYSYASSEEGRSLIRWLDERVNRKKEKAQ